MKSMKRKHTRKAVDPVYFKVFQISPRKGDLQKHAIVQEALKQISSKGLGEVTLRSIGEKLGIQRSHVAYYFKSKSELISAVVQLVIAVGSEIVVSRIKDTGSASEAMESYVDANFEWLRLYPDHAAPLLPRLLWSFEHNERRVSSSSQIEIFICYFHSLNGTPRSHLLRWG